MGDFISPTLDEPMSHDSTYCSPSLIHICNDSRASSTRIVSYIGRQYARTVPNVDIVGSSKCHTRHLAIGGVARFNYVLVTNPNPVTTYASDGQVNPYPNKASNHDSIRVDGTRELADGTPGDGRSRRTRDGLGALATGGHGAVGDVVSYTMVECRSTMCRICRETKEGSKGLYFM